MWGACGSYCATRNRLKLFCAESIKCPTTSFLLHFAGMGLLENSESLIALNFTLYSITSALSSGATFFIVTTRLMDQCEILHSFHPATAEGVLCVCRCDHPSLAELFSNPEG